MSKDGKDGSGSKDEASKEDSSAVQNFDPRPPWAKNSASLDLEEGGDDDPGFSGLRVNRRELCERTYQREKEVVPSAKEYLRETFQPAFHRHALPPAPTHKRGAPSPREKVRLLKEQEAKVGSCTREPTMSCVGL